MEDYRNKITIIYMVFLFLIIVFLIRVIALILHKPDYFIKLETTKKDLALRGEIFSKDGYQITKNEKIYNVAIYPEEINRDKKELFVNLLSIYTDKPKEIFEKALNSHKKRVVILKKIPYKIKKNLLYLSKLFIYHKVFLANNSKIIHGFDIFAETARRVYNFNDRLQPILGYLRYKIDGSLDGMGLEKYYNTILEPKQNGFIKGERDVNGRIIYDDNVIAVQRIDGKNLLLNINFILQGKIENLLDEYKKKLKAKEIISVVMESRSGKIIAIASTNRYNFMKLQQKDIPNLKISHIQYTYEPGSVMKPIILALLLELKRVSIFDVVDAHNGVFYLDNQHPIYDDEKFKWLNIIQAVVHSSNIVFAQLGLKLTPVEFREGLLKFGFGKKSGIDLPYEHKGVLFSTKELLNKFHRASNSFGYAIQVNLIQLLKAYNVFNNNGIMVEPKIADKYGEVKIVGKKIRVIPPSIAETILKILRKVVLQGTAKRAYVDGIWTAGKTGTAKININGIYVDGLYNSSFIGFANDKESKYTIAVVVIEPDKKIYFASKTAVVIFREIVKKMLELNLLEREVKNES